VNVRNRVTDPAAQLTTAAVATASGYSPQQVRDLEGLGVIAAASRSANGYRRFSAVHLRDLHAYRELARAVGPVDARRAMREIRDRPPAQAAAVVCGFHTRLNSERDRALAARSALESIRDEVPTDDEPADEDSMTISELSQALGVKASTLRFWEQRDLVKPEHRRTRAGTARRYTVAAIREARITAALRAGGYRIPDVQTAISAVRDLDRDHHADGDAETLAALDAMLQTIGDRALALLRAGTLLAEIIASPLATSWAGSTASRAQAART